MTFILSTLCALVYFLYNKLCILHNSYNLEQKKMFLALKYKKNGQKVPISSVHQQSLKLHILQFQEWRRPHPTLQRPHGSQWHFWKKRIPSKLAEDKKRRQAWTGYSQETCESLRHRHLSLPRFSEIQTSPFSCLATRIRTWF